ncbi:MAG: WbqC family protein [Flavobacteriales bacterium]|tara:strand:- start:74 stop:688 length:615 start_codon:yes stop_codon:yes gene_type:complete
MTLLYPTYFPNIISYIVMAHAEKLVFEVQDSYQKQTYRNRCYICGANGKLGLHIPVKYSQKNRQNTSEILIDNSSNWQSIHWKSLESAYKTSPYFEYYQDDLVSLFTTKKESLLGFNLECIEIINSCLNLSIKYSKSLEFNKEKQQKEYRYLVNARKESEIKINPYIQVFQEKHGFINNLSILDLLFNEGPNAKSYIQIQALTF